MQLVLAHARDSDCCQQHGSGTGCVRQEHARMAARSLSGLLAFVMVCKRYQMMESSIEHPLYQRISANAAMQRAQRHHWEAHLHSAGVPGI